MNPQTRISSITPNHFNVFGYCPRCGDYNLLNTKRYSRFTLNEMSFKAKCRKCNSLGIDVSVVKKTA